MGLILGGLGLALGTVSLIGGAKAQKKQARREQHLAYQRAEAYRRRGEFQIARLEEQGQAFAGTNRQAVARSGVTGGSATLALEASEENVRQDIAQARTNLAEEVELMRRGADVQFKNQSNPWGYVGQTATFLGNAAVFANSFGFSGTRRFPNSQSPTSPYPYGLYPY